MRGTPQTAKSPGNVPGKCWVGSGPGTKEGRSSCLSVLGWARSHIPVSDSPILVLPAPAFRNYTVGNCVHMSLAGVVLLILVAILVEAWHGQSRSQCGQTRGCPAESRLQGSSGDIPRALRLKLDPKETQLLHSRRRPPSAMLGCAGVQRRWALPLHRWSVCVSQLCLQA